MSKNLSSSMQKNKKWAIEVYMETWCTFNRYFKKDPKPTTNDMLVIQLINIIVQIFVLQ